MKWNQELNPSQLKAASQIDGQLLILAGAGSGKTKTLTHRIAHMIEEGIPAENILAITFTKKAANEMRARISSLLGDVRLPKACTFHSLGYDIVREFPIECGYRRRVGVCDASDSKARAKDALAEVEKIRGYDIEKERIENPKAESYAKDKNVIDNFLCFLANEKNQCHTYAEVSDDFYVTKKIIKQTGDFQMAYRIYQEGLIEDNLLDFDDLIMAPVLLLENNEAVANIYWNRYKYISVDEYQDTDDAQFRLIKKLTEENGNLCVVGDDYQSIYGFRGANINNILDFRHIYPNTNVVVLGENYRSTKHIVNGASEVIRNNENQMYKDLFSMNETGNPIKIVPFTDYKTEADYVVNSIIKDKKENGKSYGDFAILYRKNRLSRYIEDALMKRNLPYMIYGGISFYDRKEVKDTISYLKIISGSNDKKAFSRILNVPARGIGEKTVNAIIKGLKDHPGENIVEQFFNYANTQRKRNILEFASGLYHLYQNVNNYTSSELVMEIIRIFSYREYLEKFCKDEDDELDKRISNIEEIASKCAEFEQEYRIEHPDADGFEILTEFLANIQLITDMDRKKNTEDCIKLMTMHASKGLEFDTVFMVACERAVFQVPNNKDDHSLSHVLDTEEERRLFYVAMTRAKKNLYITYSTERMTYGKTETDTPVRFVGEIPKEDRLCVNSNNYYRGGYLERNR